MLGEGNTHTGINVWSRSSWSCSRKLRSASPDMLLQTWPGRRGGGASRSRVRVLCNTLTASDWSRQNQREGKRPIVWFSHLSNTIPAHPSCNNPRGASAKSQTETLTWKINNLPYAVGYLVYIAAPYSAKRVTLLVSVLADDVHWDAFEESLCGRKWNGINRSFNESFSNRD